MVDDEPCTGEEGEVGGESGVVLLLGYVEGDATILLEGVPEGGGDVEPCGEHLAGLGAEDEVLGLELVAEFGEVGVAGEVLEGLLGVLWIEGDATVEDP